MIAISINSSKQSRAEPWRSLILTLACSLASCAKSPPKAPFGGLVLFQFHGLLPKNRDRWRTALRFGVIVRHGQREQPEASDQHGRQQHRPKRCGLYWPLNVTIPCHANIPCANQARHLCQPNPDHGL